MQQTRLSPALTNLNTLLALFWVHRVVYCTTNRRAFKREANLLTAIGLTTKHADGRITFMLYPKHL